MVLGVNEFQSTPLMRGATRPPSAGRRWSSGFNPRPSCEGRRECVGSWRRALCVSIHAPHARGDSISFFDLNYELTFQSTPLMRGATSNPTACADARSSFNPRPSCEGRRLAESVSSTSDKFQSTPLMRGATRGWGRAGTCVRVSIHAPHARGDLTSSPTTSS